MAVGLRRNPYGAQSLFSQEQEYAEPQAQGAPFLGLDAIKQLDLDQPIEGVIPEPESLIEPVAAAELVGGEQEPSELGDYVTEAMVEQRRRLAKALMGSQQEVNHPMQAIGNAVSQITGAWMDSKAARDEADRERRRRDAFKSAVGDGADMDAMIGRLLQSGDPDLVDKGLELRLQMISSKSRGSSKPSVETFYEGDESVQKTWDPETGEWKELGRGRRWRTSGGSDGDGDGIGGGGSGGRSQKGDWVLLPDGTRVFSEFIPGRGLVYRDADGAVKPVPQGAQPVTSSQGGYLNQNQYNKVVKDFQDDDNALSRLNGYFGRVKNSNLGMRRWADGISANTKTLLASGKIKPNYTQEEIDLMAARGELQGLLGLFRTDIVGPGVMTEYDAKRVIEALGGDVTALQNPAVVEARLRDLYDQKRRSRDRNAAIIDYNRRAYPDLAVPTARAPDDLTPMVPDGRDASQAPPSRPARDPENPYKPGDIVKGYRFKGAGKNGDWRDPRNYEKVAK